MYTYITCGKFPTERFQYQETSSDGNNCMLHALISAYDPLYQQMTDIERDEYIDSVRKLMRDKFSYSEYEKTNAYRCFLESGFEEFSYQNLYSVLDENEFLGEGLIDFISDCLNVDIYFMWKDSKRKMKVYSYPTVAGTVHKNRNSVILLFDGFHYETISTLREGRFLSLLSPDDPLITSLRG